MAITINQLKRATKIYNQIQEIDKQIKTITRHAEVLANKQAEVCFHSDIIDFEPEEQGEVGFDEDGSLMPQGIPIQAIMSGMVGAGMPMMPNEAMKKGRQTKPLHLHFGNKEGLLILAAIVQVKVQQKEELFAKLQKCNVNI